MINELDGTTAVITGGASGIGLALAQRLAADGARLALADIEAPALDAVVADFASQGVDVLGARVDVSDVDQVEAFAGQVADRFGPVHVLFNNAGVGMGGPLLDPDPAYEAKFRWTMEINLMGVLYGIRAFVPAMIEHGEAAHVINTASMAGLVSGPMGAYTISKHGVVAMSEMLALEIGDTNVGVSVLCPQFVKTGIARSARNAPDGLLGSDGADQDPRRIGMMQALVDGGIDPAEVADAVVDAMAADRFTILTHDGSADGVLGRAEAIVEGVVPNPFGTRRS